MNKKSPGDFRDFFIVWYNHGGLSAHLFSLKAHYGCIPGNKGQRVLLYVEIIYFSQSTHKDALPITLTGHFCHSQRRKLNRLLLNRHLSGEVITTAVAGHVT